MRRVILVLVCAVGFAVAGAQAAVAGPHHGHNHGYNHGHNHGYYHGHHGRGWNAPVYRNVYRGPFVGVPVYPYAYAPYAYPQAGFGVSTNNFSLWFGQ